MDIKQESEEYQKCVAALSKQVANTVIETLEAYSIPEEYLNKVKGELAFNVCSIIDGGIDLNINNKSFTPTMAFVEPAADILHFDINGTYTKDYIYEFTDE